MALLFDQRGVTVGDRIVWVGPNRPELLTALFAAAQVGAVFVPLDPGLSSNALQTQLERSDPKIAIVDPTCADHVASSQAPTGAPFETITPGVEALPGDAGPTVHPAEETASELALLLTYTSGQNESPKGVVHTHGSLLHTVLNGVAAHDMRSDDIVLAFEPMWRLAGLTIQPLPVLYVGGTVVIHPVFDPATVLIDLEAQAATNALFVPETMRAVVDHEDWLFTRFASLRGVMTSSATVPIELHDAFTERGIRTGQIYGTAETGPTAAVLRFDDSDIVGAAGKAALHTRVRLDADGEILVRGPNLFTGYWGNAEATDGAFVDGWFRTGDLGHYDEDGWLFVDGRTG